MAISTLSFELQCDTSIISFDVCSTEVLIHTSKDVGFDIVPVKPERLVPIQEARIIYKQYLDDGYVRID